MTWLTATKIGFQHSESGQPGNIVAVVRDLDLDVRRADSGSLNGTFEVYVAGNVALYAHVMTEQGGSAFYELDIGTFGVALPKGRYSITFYKKSGSLSESDLSSPLGIIAAFDWDGSEEAPTFSDIQRIHDDEFAAEALERLMEGANLGAVDTSTLAATTTVFETDLAGAEDDIYLNQALRFGEGTTNAGLTFYIETSEGITANPNNKTKITLEGPTPFVPADGDVFEVIGTRGV